MIAELYEIEHFNKWTHISWKLFKVELLEIWIHDPIDSSLKDLSFHNFVMKNVKNHMIFFYWQFQR